MKSISSSKKVNYDGKSLVYEGSINTSLLSKVTQVERKSRVSLSQNTLQKLYNRNLISTQAF